MNISKFSLNVYKCKHCNCMQQICTSSLVDSSRIVENQQTVEHKIFCCIVQQGLHPNNLSSFKVNFQDCILIFFFLLFFICCCFCFFLKSVTFFSEWIIMFIVCLFSLLAFIFTQEQPQEGFQLRLANQHIHFYFQSFCLL